MDVWGNVSSNVGSNVSRLTTQPPSGHKSQSDSLPPLQLLLFMANWWRSINPEASVVSADYSFLLLVNTSLIQREIIFCSSWKTGSAFHHLWMFVPSKCTASWINTCSQLGWLYFISSLSKGIIHPSISAADKASASASGARLPPKCFANQFSNLAMYGIIPYVSRCQT